MTNDRWLRAGAWALALAYVWWLLAWSVRPEHFFFADDWDWLYRAMQPLRGQFTVLPENAYNDRPMGALVYRALYATFGLNPVPFHWTLLLLHLLNMTLVLALARRLLRSWWLAAATALAYGGWSAANEAVSWMGEIFEVLANTLVLLTILTFSSRRWPVRAVSVVCFYLALRTRESPIVTPVVLLIIVLVNHHRKEWILPHAVFAAIFGVVYLSLLPRHQVTVGAGNPYHMEFTPRAFIEGLYYYVSTMFYGRPWPVGRLIRWAAAAVLVGAGLMQRARATLVGLAGFVLYLAPVLFLPHQRQALYLYIPALFFTLAIAGGAEALARGREAAAVALMLLCVVALPHRAKMASRADWLLSHTSRAKSDIDTFRAHVPILQEGARIALIGFPQDYHVFQTLGCSVVKVYYRVDQVSCAPAADGAGADVAVTWHPEGIEVK